jgi:hypothetical protein
MSPITAFRVGLPLGVAIAGIVLAVTGDTNGVGLGVTLMVIAPLIVIIDIFVRVGFAPEGDRRREQSDRKPLPTTRRWRHQRSR